MYAKMTLAKFILLNDMTYIFLLILVRRFFLFNYVKTYTPLLQNFENNKVSKLIRFFVYYTFKVKVI